METKRQQKVARLLQKELAEIFQNETHLTSNQALITVTQVNVSKDLSVVRVFLSIFSTKDKMLALNLINDKKKEIRFKLGQRIKNQLRAVPELIFYLDDTLDHLENIDNLLKK